MSQEPITRVWLVCWTWRESEGPTGQVRGCVALHLLPLHRRSGDGAQQQ